MKKEIYNKTKENVAKALGVSSFIAAIKISEYSHDAMIANARNKLKIKCRTKIKDLSSGDPYIMLGRKVDSEGGRTS